MRIKVGNQPTAEENAENTNSIEKCFQALNISTIEALALRGTKPNNNNDLDPIIEFMLKKSYL